MRGQAVGPLSRAESSRRRQEVQQRKKMMIDARHAFGDVPMVDNSMLIVWTKAQMRGVRSMIRRLRMV